MCGICGIIDFSGKGSEVRRRETVQMMNQALLHRGPDESGMLHKPSATLAMRRLAIIDLSGGSQPIYNETGEIGVVFNGEIYNYAELKEELLQEGHVFKTSSDTEVLVHLYESYGINFIEKLRGIFSFCIYDGKEEIFLLSRDRFGEKPLYYHFDGKTFSFSSEIKSLLENFEIPRVLNVEALAYYFRTSLVPEPITLFKNIESLTSGNFIMLSKDGLRIETYFEPDYEIEKALFENEEEAIQEIEPFLRNAVRRQMVSDVPVGAFLSGGIDSSTIVALMQQQSDRPIKTFNVRFEDEDFDESKIAKSVAEHCGTDHHELFIPNLDFEESIFWTIIDHVGLPFRDSSAIPTFLISREISKSVKVALSGDGGDELFGGYSLFQWYQRIIQFQKIAKPIRATADVGLSLLQKTPGLKSSSQIRKIKRGIHTSLEAPEDVAIALNELFSIQQIKEIGQGSRKLNTWSRRVDFPLLKSFPANYHQYSDLRKILVYRLRHTLPSNMLIKVDRMSMANSLEVRSPFLDPDLFAITQRLPDKFLINKGKGKYLLRKIMKPHLPDSVFNHPKKGFSIPLAKYQNENFKTLAKRLLFAENPLPELIAPAFLQEVYQRGIMQHKDSARMSVFQSSHQLWMMMQLLGWAKRFNVELA